MSAGKLDLLIEQGATFRLKATLQDSLGAPINLTGKTFTGQVRATATSTDSLGAFSFAIPDQSVPANLGILNITMLPGITLGLPSVKNTSAVKKTTSLAYDIESTMSDGTVERWLEGVVTLSPVVTR